MRARFLLLAVLLCAALPAHAQPPLPPSDVQVTVAASVGQYNRQKVCLPVTVAVDNRGSEREFTLRLLQNGTDLIEPTSLRVPARTRKQLVLACPLYNGWSTQVDVVVEYRGRKLARAAARLNQANDDDLVVCLLTPNQTSDFSYLSSYMSLLQGGNQPEIRLNQPEPGKLPEHWSGWLGLDVVVLSDPARVNLSESATEALVCWTRAGGTLVLVSSGDPGEYRGSRVENLLPMEPRASVDRSGLTLVNGPVTRGTVLATHEGEPLLLQAPAGAGQVYMIAANLSSQDLLGTEPTRALWQPILTGIKAGADPRFGMSDTTLLRHLPEMRLPSAGLLAWLLLLYVLVVGPINFAVLRKRDRMLWIFVTVPILAGLFTMGTFVTTYFSRGTSTVVRELGRIEATSGQNQAVLDAAMTVYSPVGRNYDLEFPSATAALLQPGNTGNPAESQPALVLTEVMRYPHLVMEMSALRRLAVRSTLELQGPVSLELEGQTALLDNGTGMTLDPCFVVVGSQRSQTFKLAPGRSRVELQWVESVDPLRAARDILKPDTDDPIAADRVTVMTRSLQKGPPGPVLLGWTDQAGSGIRIHNGSFKHHRSYILVVKSQP
ncbi:MAG: hypothetical protein AB1758_04465 [Candidatus Eremiobacterota bacterium]